MRASVTKAHGRGALLRRLAATKEAGVISAEYAIGTLVAAGFAAVLLAVISSSAVRDLIAGVITSALQSVL